MLAHVRFARQTAVSVVGLFVSRVGLHVPAPGVDPLTVAFWLGEAASAAGSSWLVRPTFTPIEVISIFSLGLKPYLAGAVLVLLLSGWIGPLRKLRDGDLRQNAQFDRWILAVTVGLALLQAYALSATFLSSTPGAAAFDPHGGADSPPLAVLSWTAGAALLVALAYFITARGLSNGVALLVLTGWLAGLLPALGQQVDLDPELDLAPLGKVLRLLIGVGLVIGAWLYVRAGTMLRLVPATLGLDGEPNARLTIPLRLNVVGVLPVVVAATCVQVPVTLAHFGLLPVSVLTFPETPLYWLLYCLAIIVATFLLTSWILSIPNLLSSLRRWGYTLDGEVEERRITARLERTLLAGAMASALLLCVLTLLSGPAARALGLAPRLAMALGPLLFMAAAVGADTLRQVTEARELAETTDPDSVTTWTEILRSETRLELECARAVLGDRGIDARLRINRAIAIAGSLAPWEVCRPAYPALVIYRNLGGGRAALLVAREDAARAREILAPYLDRGDEAGSTVVVV